MNSFSTIQKELLPLLQQAEKRRRVYRFFKVMNSLLLQFILLLGISIPLFVYLFSSKLPKWFEAIQNKDLWHFSPQLYMLLFWGFFFFFMMLSRSQKAKYGTIEKQIIRAVIGKIAPTFKFDEHKQINPKVIAESELISTHQLRFKKATKVNSVYNLSRGILSGKVSNTSITMGAVKTLNHSGNSYFMYVPGLNYLYIIYNYIRPWFSKKHTLEQVGSQFLGMFAIVEFNKNFNGTTIILPDQFEKRIGYLAKTIQSLNISGNQLVNLEDTEFENEFVVYSSDQVEARYVMSTSLMQRITRLKKKIGKPIMLSFKNNKLYFAVYHPYGFLRLNESKNLITSNALELLYEDIVNAIGIVEDLNLNTKIWKNVSTTKSV